MLRNLEDERMRMVRPRPRGAGWVVAPPLPPAALPAVGDVAPPGHRGVQWLQAPVPLPLPVGEQREGRVNFLVGHTWRTSVTASCCWKMASAGAGRARRGEEQVWYKPLSLLWVLRQHRAGGGEACGFLWAAGGFPWERLLSSVGVWG